MTQDIRPSFVLKSKLPTPAFEESLALGAILATLVVVALGCLLSDDSSVRAQFVLAGFEVILLILAAGLIASVLHSRIAARRFTALEGKVVLERNSAEF